MANNINGINGYGYGYGVSGYGNRNNSTNAENANEEASKAVVPEQKPQVSRDEVMKFLEQNNFYIAPTSTQNAQEAGEVDAETQDRIAGYMERFEVLYAIIEEEFGQELAPSVMDLAMDVLMGM